MREVSKGSKTYCTQKKPYNERLVLHSKFMFIQFNITIMENLYD